MTMKHFKNENGEVFGFDQDQILAGMSEGLTPLDQGEEAELLSPKKTRADVEAERIVAYSHPVTGSDRFFSEAARLHAMGASQKEIDEAKSAGVHRYQEIQAAYPWPVDSE